MGELAPLIAIVGCDGSGKSTLAADLLTHIGRTRPAASGYLGLGSGAMGNRIKALPLIGTWAERFLRRRADQARDPGAVIPGLGTALVLYRFSLKRKAQFEELLALRRKGTTIVTDRYPQIDVSGFYDGPGLSAARADGLIVGWLAARERAIYEWMASYTPTLVIRLNVDVETALARKPDHSRTLIERKVAVTPSLKFNGAPIIDIDANADYEGVLLTAISEADSAIVGSLGGA